MKATQDIVIGNYVPSDNKVLFQYRFQLVRLILQLQRFKQYRQMTGFIAVSIADKFLHATLDRGMPSMSLLAATTVLMAAKLEEHLQPNLDMMIDALASFKSTKVKAHHVKKLEIKILNELQFDVQWTGISPFLERFLHLLDIYQSDPLA